MFEGFYSTINSESVADYGAKRVLGIGGSLSGYIQTGNAYDRRFYHKKSAKDEFIKKDLNKKKYTKIASIALALAGGIGACYAFAKNKIKPDKIISICHSAISKLGGIFKGIKK